MATFIRYISKPEHAEEDIERGYSFRAYEFYETEQDALDSHFARVLERKQEDLNVMPAPNGMFGFALEGLCGIEVSDEDDDIEAARQQAREDRGYMTGANADWHMEFPYAAICTGTNAGRADEDDGDIFIWCELVEVIEL